MLQEKRVENVASSRIALAIGTGTNDDSDSWILVNESSVHLVKDVKMLKNVSDCDQLCRAANSTMVKVTKAGSVQLKTVVNGIEVIVDLTEVYYAENLSGNIISHGKLEGVVYSSIEMANESTWCAKRTV